MENTIDKMNELNLNELVTAITAPPGEEVLKLRSKVIENKYRWNKNSLLSGNMLEFKMPLIELVISLLFRTGADFLTFSALSTGEVTECNPISTLLFNQYSFLITDVIGNVVIILCFVVGLWMKERLENKYLLLIIMSIIMVLQLFDFMNDFYWSIKMGVAL